jgi:hypothetical protein
MTKAMIRVLLLAVFCLSCLFGAGIDGKWTATYEVQGNSITTTWDLKADGTKLTGKATSSLGEREITDGKIEGNNVSWTENVDAGGTAIKVTCTGTLNGDELKLSRQVAEFGSTDVVAKRVK